MSGQGDTPGRKKRENNFYEPGIRGRQVPSADALKTGLVLKDTGVRDKDGLEPIEGIFSSPEKAADHHTRKSNVTLSDSEDMEFGQSSAPEPVDVLSGRKVARDSQRPPPLGRSPIKTNIGATPRRQSSTGPASSPKRRTPGVRASSHPIVNRLLDFSMTESRLSVESSGGRSVRRSNGHKANNSIDMFDIPENLDEPAVPAPRRSFRRSDASDSANGETNNDLEHEDIQINGTNGGSPAPMPIMDDNNDGDDDDDDDDDVVTNSFQHEQAELIPEESTPRTNHVDNENVDDVSTKKGRGRGRPSNVSLASIHDVPDTTFDTDEANANSAPKRKRGRPPKNSKPLVDTEPVEKPRKRTRLTFQQADAETRSDSGPVQESEVQALGEDGQGLEHNMVDEPGQEQEQEPEEEQQQEEHPEPVKPKTGKGTKSKKPPPSKKDPNAKMTSKSAKAAKLQDNDFKQPGVIKGVQRIREETPMEDEGALHTRSGRLSYKPLAHWKGEQALFEVGPGWGQTVQSLIRVEEVTPMKGAAGKSRGRPRKKHKTPVFRDAQHEVQDAEEPWEADEGIVTGPVRLWDPEIEQGVDEGAEQEIAYAASRIQARDVPEASFRFAKTLTMPFFGCGVVELPPGGFKHRKNTRRMQMVFFVHYGKVTVEVGGTRFAITKGGMWQVPRGNFYSISNETDQDAKIFFSQGCEMMPEVADAELEPQPA